MKKISLISLFQAILLFFAWNASAQEDDFRKGVYYFEEKDYARAISYLDDAIYLDPSNTEAKYYAGICYLQLKSPARALQLLESVEKSKKIDNKPMFFYWIGLAAYYDQQFFRAQEYLARFNDKVNESFDRQELALIKKRIETATTLYENPNGFYVENLGNVINTEGPEYNSLTGKDLNTIFFTQRKHSDNKEIKKDKLNYYAYENILFAQKKQDGTWAAPQLLSREFIEEHSHEATVQLFDNDQKLMLFHRNDLYITELVDGKWRKPYKMDKSVNTLAKEAHGFITEDGKILFLATDAYSKQGDLDLMMLLSDGNGGWGEPQPVNMLNTTQDEESPFLAADGYFYFCSKGHNSIGGYDIFRSKFNPRNRSFTKPENLGYPINSVNDDVFFNVNANGIGYFTSNRSGGYGQEDIYMAYMFDKTILAGTVYEEETGQPVPNSLIRFIDKNAVRFVTTDAQGNYSIEIPLFSEYTVKVFYDGILRQQEYFKPEIDIQNPKKIEKNFYINGQIAMKDKLTPEERNALKYMVNGYVRDARSSNVIANATVKLQDNEQNGLVLNQVATDENGFFEMPIFNAEGDFSLAGNAENYLANTEQFFAIDAVDGVIRRDIFLKQAQIGSRFLVKNVYFDFDMATIKEVSYPNLDKLVNFMAANPALTVEIEGHTDSVGPDDYNQVLSLRRARAVVQFLREKGIAAERMTAVGYGESRPMASNDDEAEGREFNRRIEIKIMNNQKIITASKE